MPHSNCCVPLCPNRRGNTDTIISFHSIPTELSIRKQWIVKIRRDIGSKFKITTNTRICSVHFKPVDFFPRNSNHKLPRLKSTAIPSIFTWNNDELKKSDKRLQRLNARKEKQKSLQERKKLRAATATTEDDLQVGADNNDEQVGADNNDQQLEDCTTNSVELSNEEEIAHLKMKIASLEVENARLRDNEGKIKSLSTEISQLEKEVVFYKNAHLKCKQRLLSYTNVRQCDDLVAYYTGFPNRKTFDAVLEYLMPKVFNLSYWRGKRSRNDVKIFEHKPGMPAKLAEEEMFFLVLVRLRLGLPVVELSRLFGVSTTTLNRIFTTWITFLYHEFKDLFKIPPVQIIKQASPHQFIDYPETTVIIDCSEIKIQKPSLLKAQKETYSNYKHGNTFKFLIGVTPGGMVCFVSDLYGGSSSDTKIVIESKFIESLGDDCHGIMADKGFDISDLLPKNMSLNIPPKFMKKLDGQMPVGDVLRTRRIAAVRVHVERAIRRLKAYHILDGVIPLNMNDISDQVVVVCAYLTNFKCALVKSKVN